MKKQKDMVVGSMRDDGNDMAQDTANALWSGQIKNLLLATDDQSCIIVRERFCEEIFAIIADNIHDVLLHPRFSSTVLSKLEEWRFCPVDSGERRIYQKYSFLADLLQPPRAAK